MNYAMRTIALALLMFLAGNSRAAAQEWWGGVTYQTALSSGDMADFVDQFSWRNIGIEGRSMIGSNASVGIFLGWNVFHDEVDGTVSLGAVDASGYQSRFVNAVPLLATAHYYFGRPSGPRPYVGAGIGTYWIENRLELGLTGIEATNWHFGLAPEFGVIIPTQGMADTYLSVKYNYAHESGDISRSYWTFGIGFGSRY
jgi:hypothetical protein